MPTYKNPLWPEKLHKSLLEDQRLDHQDLTVLRWRMRHLVGPEGRANFEPISRETIAAEFGERVAGLVQEATDDKSLPKLVRKQLQIETAPEEVARREIIETGRQGIEPALDRGQSARTLADRAQEGLYRVGNRRCGRPSRCF